VIVHREQIVERLSVSVFAHEIDAAAGKVAVWTYVSRGLWAHKQRELRISVLREASDADADFPRDLFDVYRLIREQAGAGELVVEGGTSELRRGLFGRTDLRCLLYVPAQAFPGVPIEAPSLTALVVTRAEAHSAEFGPMRAMLRIGVPDRQYPTTPWIDRKRYERIDALGNEGSALVGSTPVFVTARARREGDRTVMLVLTTGTDEMKAMFRHAPEGGIPLTLSFDPTADSYLVWWPSQKGVEALAPPGSKGKAIGLDFLVIRGGSPIDRGNLVEDGYMAMFTDASWARVRDALEHGKPLELPLANKDQGDVFEIRWVTKSGARARGR
jgi:hypothetical protein